MCGCVSNICLTALIQWQLTSDLLSVCRLPIWWEYQTPTVQQVRRDWWTLLSLPGLISLSRWPARTWWTQPVHSLRYSTCDHPACHTNRQIYHQCSSFLLLNLNTIHTSLFRCFLQLLLWPNTPPHCATLAVWHRPTLPTLLPRGSLCSRPKKWPTPLPTWSSPLRFVVHCCHQLQSNHMLSEGNAGLHNWPILVPVSNFSSSKCKSWRRKVKVSQILNTRSSITGCQLDTKSSCFKNLKKGLEGEGQTLPVASYLFSPLLNQSVCDDSSQMEEGG